MEVEFREARNIRKLSQLNGAMQIRAKMVDDTVNSLGILTALRIAVDPDICAWHRNIVA